MNRMTTEEKDYFYSKMYPQPYKVGEKVTVKIEDKEFESNILRITYEINLKHHKYYVENYSDYLLSSNLKKLSN